MGRTGREIWGVSAGGSALRTRHQPPVGHLGKAHLTSCPPPRGHGEEEREAKAAGWTAQPVPRAGVGWLWGHPSGWGGIRACPTTGSCGSWGAALACNTLHPVPAPMAHTPADPSTPHPMGARHPAPPAPLTPLLLPGPAPPAHRLRGAGREARKCLERARTALLTSSTEGGTDSARPRPAGTARELGHART